MTQSCKKPVYRTMCESDKGVRHGKYRGVRYESNRKRNQTTSKPKTKGTAKAVPKATAKTTKKDEAIWKAMGRGMFKDDRPDYDAQKEIRHIDDMEESETYEAYNKQIQRMFRDEELRKAYAKRVAAKRRKTVKPKAVLKPVIETPKDPRDSSVWIPAIIHSPYIEYEEHNGKSFIHETDKAHSMPVMEVYRKVKSTKHKIVFMNPYEIFRGTHKDKKYVLKELEKRPDFDKNAIRRK